MTKRTAIATALGTDVSEVEPYQPTREKGVYVYEDDYYTARKISSGRIPPLPTGYDWNLVACDWVRERYGMEIFKATSDVL